MPKRLAPRRARTVREGPDDNPFVIGQHAEGEGFADRRAELERFTGAMRDTTSRLVVYGDRRLGKSSALLAAAERVRTAGQPVAYVDLAQVSSAVAAAQRVLTAVQREVGAPAEDLLKRVATKLRGAVTVSTTVDPTGPTTVSLKLEPGTVPGTLEPRLVAGVLDAIDEGLRKRGRSIALVLDEFQRLLAWGGEDVEWALKSSLEAHRQISYVLAGSARSLIADMVSHKRRALWGVVEAVEFGPIDDALLVRWI